MENEKETMREGRDKIGEIGINEEGKPKKIKLVEGKTQVMKENEKGRKTNVIRIKKDKQQRKRDNFPFNSLFHFAPPCPSHLQLSYLFVCLFPFSRSV